MVSSLKGIEFFPNLQILYARGNLLTSLDVSHNPKLTDLYVGYNQITSLDLSNNADLRNLYADHNGMTSLKLPETSQLVEMRVNNNQLASLKVSQAPKLVWLYANDNKLTSLDAGTSPQLRGLYAENNELTSIDTSKAPGLPILSISNNRLTSLDLSQNAQLSSLHASNNRLSSLNLSRNAHLSTVEVNDNRLTSLDLPGSALGYLYASNNKLSSLDVSSSKGLRELRADDNQLSSLDVTHNPNMVLLSASNNRLSSLDTSSNTQLKTLRVDGNRLSSLDLTANTELGKSAAGQIIMDASGNQLLAHRETATLQWHYRNTDLSDQKPYAVDGSSLNLKELIPWFDLSKVSNVQGGTLKQDGTLVPTGSKPGSTVSYDYAISTNPEVAPVEPLHPVVVFSMNPNPPVTYRTVAFNSNGGSAVASQKVANGAKVKQPANPTRGGYTFAGWYYGNAKWDFNRGVTANITLTAKWTKNAEPSKPSVKQVPVYRVYNRNSGLHHYTINKAENDMLVRLGWRDENRGGSAFVTVSKDTPGAKPVYREYNRRSGNHNWTLNKKEHDMLVRLGWKDEGIAWYTSPTGRDVYRLYNPKPYHKPKNGRGNGGGEHVYTTSYAEYRAVVAAGWRGEGVAWKSL
ncbi:InlB B-repeat-containing protein [Bifidobacterium simiarum]|nr:InlB B-repeat-containing protein [Bifidobacterium simiarum]